MGFGFGRFIGPTPLQEMKLQFLETFRTFIGASSVVFSVQTIGLN